MFAFAAVSLFKNFDSKSLLDNYKFDIKKAKEIN